MTKREAIEAMLNGSKVTHQLFIPEEFIYMESGKVFDEDGYEHKDFWWERYQEYWNDNWSIYREIYHEGDSE